MRRRLLERRVVTLVGPLDDAGATGIGAALMTLDADGDCPVQLQGGQPRRSTGAALALMDIIDLLGVEVHGWCTGQVGGPASWRAGRLPPGTIPPRPDPTWPNRG